MEHMFSIRSSCVFLQIHSHAHPMDEKLTGCIAISLIVFGIVCCVRLIISERKK